MRVAYSMLWMAAWVYGEVTLIAADHWGWALGSIILMPVAVIHGVGHALGYW